MVYKPVLGGYRSKEKNSSLMEYAALLQHLPSLKHHLDIRGFLECPY